MFGRHLFRSPRLQYQVPHRSYAPKTKKNDNAAESIGLHITPNGIITPGSDEHNDLLTFLEYTTRSGVSPTSSVYVGTHYEYTVASSLRSLGFTLTRTGRATDLGIDLLGHWQVPSLPASLRVFLQCKLYKAPTPANVRELEGSFSGAPAGWKGEGVLGFLASTSPATKGMRDALIRSSVPMGFLQVTDVGTILQFVWNHQATQNGLEGMGVTTRFSPQVDGGKTGNGVEQEIALTWNGWMMSKEQPPVEIVAVKPKVSDARKSKATSKAAEEPEMKKRGRPRKTAEPEVKKRGRPRKAAESEVTAKVKKTAKVPKKTVAKARVAKSRKDMEKRAKGQQKKG